jgi:hypothetical protein
VLYVVFLEAGYSNCKHPVLSSLCCLVHALQCTLNRNSLHEDQFYVIVVSIIQDFPDPFMDVVHVGRNKQL